MLTESPDSGEPNDFPTDPEFMRKLALRWSEQILKGIDFALTNGNLSFELKDQFEATYPITQWLKILRTAELTFIDYERYEDCNTCQNLAQQTEIRLLTCTTDEP
jgi:hypothetical protein